MKTTTKILASASLALFATIQPLHAQHRAQTEDNRREAGLRLRQQAPVVSRFTDRQLVALLRNEGYGKPEMLKKGAIRFRINGLKVVLRNVKNGDLLLWACFSGTGHNLQTVNAWNRKRRLSRAYIDRDGDAVIESDLLSNGGITERNVTAFLRAFAVSIAAYREHLRQSAQSPLGRRDTTT